MKDTLRAEKTRIVHIKDLHGRWTFLAKLTYIHNSGGVPPKSPTPHFPPFPLKSVSGAVEDMLMATSGEVVAGESGFEVKFEEIV